MKIRIGIDQKPKRKIKRPEQDLQRACVKWFRTQYPKLKIHHSPNGGKRGRVEAAIFKSLGTSAGFPDLIVIGPHRVVFFELKSDTGRPTDSQKEWGEFLLSCGHPWFLVSDFDDFRRIIGEIFPL